MRGMIASIMPRFSSIFIIYNPNSTGDSKQMSLDLAKELRSARASPVIRRVPTRYAGHAVMLARQIAMRYARPLIVSASGDGGYNEVVNGVMSAQKHKAVCAVLPAGNANDHSRTMQSDALGALIKTGKTSRIDLLSLRIDRQGQESVTRYAHSYIGLGLTPVIAVELNRHDLNAFRELKIAVQRFYKYRPFTIRRGQRKLKLNSLLFANINQMAKVLTLAESNRPDDGKFEVVAFPAGKKRKLAGRLLKAAVSKLDTTRSLKTYEFEVVKKMPIQLDGEITMLQKGDNVRVNSEHKRLETLI